MSREQSQEVTAYIVEDISAARENLKMSLAEYCPQIELIGEAGSVVEALKLLKDKMPDILFLDIELGNETAFDLLDLLPELDSHIIFTTASQEYAIRAFRYAAVDYLLKPIDPDELVEAVNRAQQKPHLESEQVKVLTNAMTDQTKVDRIALHTLEKMYIVDVSSILRCEADGNYTMFYIDGRTPILVTRTLKEYDQLLSPGGFIRVHQSHLVNTRAIREYVKVDGGYLVMNNGNKVPVSTRKRSQVLAQLDQL